MSSPLCDENLLKHLPLPLAQLYRRAHNAKTPLERHLTAYYLWEAALKLLGSVAIVAYAERSEHDAELSERLTKLARPSVGDWWEFVRRLVPLLAEGGVDGFARIREQLLGRTRDDMPRAAGLDAALREALAGKGGARTTVYLAELFERLVRYRNREVGHGAAGQQPVEFYERMGNALLAGIGEVLARLDVLAGRRLVYVAEVRQLSGNWLIQRYELAGESPRRVETLQLARGEVANLPDADRIYLTSPTLENAGKRERSLHPLVIHQAEAGEVLFLNARRGRARAEFLCYTSGRRVDRDDLGGEHRTLLTRVLGIDVADTQVEAWADRAQAEEGPRPEPAAPALRTLGEFELLSELGRGGMGVVFRAWQPSLGRQVALKCMYRTGDPKAEARFAREIQALGRVEHPNLVKIFTAGSDGDQWFYAMELVEGVMLSSMFDRLSTCGNSAAGVDSQVWQQTVSTACLESRQAEKSLSGEGGSASGLFATGRVAPAAEKRASIAVIGNYVFHVVELIRQVAQAVHMLNEKGIVHRDIKPGNIILTSDGAHAVLMDLGLAQVVDPARERVTQTRQFVGTVRYASPEQVLAVGPVDCRSDVYGLGATLWELLTLRPLFGANHQMPTPELMQRIQFEEPVRPRKYNPSVSRDLSAVVMKCLEKDPRHRYASAADLAGELQNILDGKPVKARPVSPWVRAGKWIKRQPAKTAVIVLSVLLIALVSLGFAGPWGQPRQRESQPRVVYAEEQVRQTAARCRHMLMERLRNGRLQSGWIRMNLDPSASEGETWAHSQALAGLFAAPDLTAGDRALFADSLDVLFDPKMLIEKNQRKYGWLAHVGVAYTQAEPALWTLIATANALKDRQFPTGPRRRQLESRLGYVQEVLDTYRPELFKGGWNRYPHQKEPSAECTYTTTLVLLALLETRQAGMPWKGSEKQRDELLASTAGWLIAHFDADHSPPGWRATGIPADHVLEGLTLQIYGELLRAQLEAGVAVPPPIVEQAYAHLILCGDHPDDYPDTSENTRQAFRTHEGAELMGRQGLTFCWYPWALYSGGHWLRHAESSGAPAAKVARVRAALGHLVVDFGEKKADSAGRGWTFLAAETLMAFSVIAPP